MCLPVKATTAEDLSRLSHLCLNLAQGTQQRSVALLDLQDMISDYGRIAASACMALTLGCCTGMLQEAATAWAMWR